jgi:hypothetical protein
MVENLDFKINASIDAENVNKTFKSLKQELKQLKEQIASGGLDAKQLSEATNRAAQLTDHLGDVNQKIKALSSDTKKIDAVVEGFRGLAGGVAVVTGAMGFLGVENENVEKTLLKVQSATALLTGIQELSNLATGEGILKTTYLSVAQALAGKSAKIMGIEITAAMAAATAGISLIVAGIAYLVVEMNNTEETAKKTQERLGKMYEKDADVYKSVLQKRAELLQGSNEGELKALKLLYDQQYRERLRAQKETGQSQKSFDAETRVNLELYNKQRDEINKKWDEKEKKDAKDKQDKKAQEQATADAEALKKAEEEARKKEEILEKAEAQRRLISELNLRQIQDVNTKELETLDEKYEQEKFQYRDNAVALIELEKVYQIEREKILESQRLKAKEITDKELQDKIDAEKEAQYKIQSFKDFEKQYNVERIDLDNMYSQIVAENASLTTEKVIAEIQKRLKAKADANEIEKQGDIDKANAIIKTAQYGAGAIDSINQLISQQDEERVKRGEITEEQAAKRAFNRNKAYGIVNAAINTAAGVTAVLASPTNKLDPSGTLQSLQIAFVVAAGAAQIAKIASQKFEPKSGGTGPGPGPGPTLPSGATQPTVQTGQFSNFSDFKPGELQEQRVYVVESDITGVQRKVRVIENRSRY